MPTSVPTTVASTMPITATRSVLTTPTMKAQQISVLRSVGEPGVGDRHAGFAAEEGKAGRDAAHRQIVHGVGPQPGDQADHDADHQDLPEQARKRSSCSEKLQALARRGLSGVDVVTAQEFSSVKSEVSLAAARFKCCIEIGNMQHLFHGRAAVEILALDRALQRLAVAADAAAGSRPLRRRQRLRRHHALDARARLRRRRRSRLLHASCQGDRLFRLGRIARGADRGAAAGAILAVLRARARKRHGPNADVSLVCGQARGGSGGSFADFAPTPSPKRRGRCMRARRIWIAGFRSCRSVAELLNYELRLFRPDDVQLVGGSGPEDLDFGAFRSGDAVVVIGFAPYSTASVESTRAALKRRREPDRDRRFRHRADGRRRRSSPAL